MKNKRIYMDYAATTPIDRGVESAMRLFYADTFGNPSSSHLHGQAASRAVFLARQAIAKALNADYTEIVFTGSATEANNLAIFGAFEQVLIEKKNKSRIIISAIEHESVYEACMALKRLHGAEIIEIPVSGEGIIDLKKLEGALNENTVLVSVQMANSELGVTQPIKEIGESIKKYKAGAGSAVYPLFHTDAVQAFQYMKCDAVDLGVDMMTLSSHKIYGPKGIGCLFIRKLSTNNYPLTPLIAGGGQENGMRSGTENVPAIVGFAKAVEITEKIRAKESKRITTLREALWKGIKKIILDAELNGSIKKRLPNNLNIYLPSRPAQDVCIELDLMGVAVSPGTACASRAAEPSRVLKALGFSGDRPLSSIRFSLGRQTTPTEIRSALTILKKRFGSMK
ncbi:MAG: cysteine desulfurase [Candidatus Pacebacteria bacterium]|nr:cysteine desulfurase [Candidatus Paceibacterota bacterium]